MRTRIIIAAVAAVAAAAALLAVTLPASASGRRVPASIAGIWDEHVFFGNGPEGRHVEHFQLKFNADGTLEQASGTLGDANAFGTWRQSGRFFVASFDDLNQLANVNIDFVHVILLGQVTGNTFRSQDTATGYTRKGSPVDFGPSRSVATRIPPVAAALLRRAGQ